MYDFTIYEQEVIPATDLGIRLAVLEYSDNIGFVVVADKSAIQAYFAGLMIEDYLVKDSNRLNNVVEGTYYGVPFVAQENDGNFTLIVIPKQSALYQKIVNGIDARGLKSDPVAEVVAATIAAANKDAANE